VRELKKLPMKWGNNPVMAEYRKFGFCGLIKSRSGYRILVTRFPGVICSKVMIVKKI